MVAAVVALAAAAAGGVASSSSTNRPTPGASDVSVATAAVERGALSSIVSVAGILTYRARPDGSPYAVINQATGTYTELPVSGSKVDCGGVLYRVNDKPVLLLCGALPAYRALRVGDSGNDVRQLNANLHRLGYGADPDDGSFTTDTQNALHALQHDKGFAETGELAFDDAVFLPEPLRIADVKAELAGAAQPGAAVLSATADTLEVHVDLDASQQEAVKAGASVQITLPGNASAKGKVDRIGRIAQAPTEQNPNPGDATIAAFITLDDPAKASGLDKAPVHVDITTTGVDGVLSVPVTAIVGKSGGGFAVEVVRSDGRRELVAVTLGLFDTAAGRVQVDGRLNEGEHVVVPSSP